MKTIIVEAITEIIANNSLLKRKVFMYSPNLHEATTSPLTREAYWQSKSRTLTQNERTTGSFDKNNLPAH